MVFYSIDAQLFLSVDSRGHALLARPAAASVGGRSEGGMMRLETLIELKCLNSSFSSSDLFIRAFRAYPLIEPRQTAPGRAVRGDSISVSSTLPPPLYQGSRPRGGPRIIPRNYNNRISISTIQLLSLFDYYYLFAILPRSIIYCDCYYYSPPRPPPARVRRRGPSRCPRPPRSVHLCYTINYILYYNFLLLLLLLLLFLLLFRTP